MKIVNAMDAISPAFSRTKLVLFSPYRFGRTWKLAATGYLSGVGVVFVPFPLLLIGLLPMLREQTDTRAMVPVVVGIVAAFTLIYLLLFYLCSRLRFAFFDIVLHRGEFVAPAWRKSGGASLRWTLFKVALGCLVGGLAAGPLFSICRKFMETFKGMNVVPGQPLSPELMSLIFSAYAAFFFVYVGWAIFYLVSSLLSDFVVPQLALEDEKLFAALHRLGKFVRREPGAVIAYALLKVGLAFVGAFAAGMAFYAALLIVAFVAVLVGGVIGFLLHLLHVPTSVLTGLAITLGAAIYGFTFFYGIVIANGTLFTFLESYSLYFLGGRYSLLGAALEASTPARPSNEPEYGDPLWSTPPTSEPSS
jgi:hypothetical protein